MTGGAARGITRSASALRRGLDDVALVIDADIDCLAVLHCTAAPHSLVVLVEVADVGKAHLLEAGFGLAFGEAITPGNRRGCLAVRGIGAIDYAVLGPIRGRRVLALCDGPGGKKGQCCGDSEGMAHGGALLFG